MLVNGRGGVLLSRIKELSAILVADVWQQGKGKKSMGEAIPGCKVGYGLARRGL